MGKVRERGRVGRREGTRKERVEMGRGGGEWDKGGRRDKERKRGERVER